MSPSPPYLIGDGGWVNSAQSGRGSREREGSVLAPILTCRELQFRGSCLRVTVTPDRAREKLPLFGAHSLLAEMARDHSRHII